MYVLLLSFTQQILPTTVHTTKYSTCKYQLLLRRLRPRDIVHFLQILSYIFVTSHPDIFRVLFSIILVTLKNWSGLLSSEQLVQLNQNFKFSTRLSSALHLTSSLASLNFMVDCQSIRLLSPWCVFKLRSFYCSLSAILPHSSRTNPSRMSVAYHVLTASYTSQ